MVTGATGFVGKAFLNRLADGQIEVVPVVRKKSMLPGERVVEDIDESTDWQELLENVDVVVHLAARVHIMQDKTADPLREFRKVNVASSEHLARAAAASGVKRLVYVSSIKVNGEAGGPFDESQAPCPQDPYGVSKWEAEEALHRVSRETGLEVVIIRPPLVYGPGVKGNFAQMIGALARGLPLPLASVRNLRSLIFVGNLADALMMCATHPAAAGQTYLVSDGEDIATPDLLVRLGRFMGHPARLLPCPLWVLRAAGYLTGKSNQIQRLLGSLQVDSGKICRELGWKPPFTVSQGLQITADSAVASRGCS